LAGESAERKGGTPLALLKVKQIFSKNLAAGLQEDLALKHYPVYCLVPKESEKEWAEGTPAAHSSKSAVHGPANA
jgi:hypothetical protein